MAGTTPGAIQRSFYALAALLLLHRNTLECMDVSMTKGAAANLWVLRRLAAAAVAACRFPGYVASISLISCNFVVMAHPRVYGRGHD